MNCNLRSHQLLCSIACASAFVVCAGSVSGADALPSFKATSLTGETVTEAKLIGQPTVLIVTPSRGAAEDTRKWAQTLRSAIDVKKVRVRDVLAIDLPFFMSERDALGRAREKIPKKYHDQTWLLAEKSLEQALNIPPSSEDAYVLVLNSQGRVMARVNGAPTAQRADEIQKAVRAITG